MVDITQNSVEQSVSIFDSFYDIAYTVNASEYDVVYSFFYGCLNNDTQAANMTAILFRIAQIGNYNIIDLLEILKGAPNKLQMNSIICYYLNTFKTKTSLYGTGQLPVPNEAVQRNVVL